MDIDFLLYLQGLREVWGPGVESAFNLVTQLGTAGVFVVIAFTLYLGFNKASGRVVLLSVAGACTVNDLLKLLVCCYRPWIRDGRLSPSRLAVRGATGYSFPSGHSATSASLFSSLAREGRKWRWLAPVCGAIIVAVMFSRVFLGCHTPQDILVGAAVGLAGAWICARVLAWIDADPSRETPALLVVLGASAIAILVVVLKPYPMDYTESGKLLVDPAVMMQNFMSAVALLDGLSLGMWFENRFVSFSDTRNWGLRALRVIPALLLLVMLNSVAAPLAQLIDVRAAAYVAVLVGSLVASGLWPWVFCQIERSWLHKVS